MKKSTNTSRVNEERKTCFDLRERDRERRSNNERVIRRERCKQRET
jgi:hypothetical protein